MRGEREIIKKHHLENLKQGGIFGGIFVIWVDHVYTNTPYKRTLEIMEAIKAEMQEAEDYFKIVRSYNELEKSMKDGKFSAFIGLEGLSSIGEDIDKINQYYDFGARHASLTWNEENALATGVSGDQDRGLTDLGAMAFKRINDLGMLFDVSHLNEKSFWDVIDMADRPLIASHSNSRKLCDVKRNLTDEQLKEIAALDGVVGINSYSEFIHMDISKQNVETLVDHIIHMADIMGLDHVGMGLDFCDYIEGFNTSENGGNLTCGLENSSKASNLIFEMRKRGFSEEDIEKISYKNFFKVIREIVK